MGGQIKLFGALAALFLAAGCDGLLGPTAFSPVPTARPVAVETPPPEPSQASRALSQYYSGVERDLTSRGLLRTDGGGADVPFNARNLSENFLRIALFDEYVVQNGNFVARQTEGILRRWKSPIRMQILFGDSVPPERRARDTANVTSYIARLSRLTGQSIRLVDSGANFHVLIQNADELAGIAPRVQALVPGIDQAPLREIVAMPRSIFCLVYAFSTSADPSTYTSAVAVIRAEHPDTLRLSCLHEEIAQGLGLPNDSPNARPSVFNDDEEFGLLTRHDEYLLRILYDPRLRNGMTEAEARPIVRTIAEELIGGDS